MHLSSWKVVDTCLSTLPSLKPANLGTVVVLWLREKCNPLLDTSEAEKLRPDWCFRLICARIWRNGLHPLGSSLRHGHSTASRSLEVIVSVATPQHLTAIRFLDSYRIHIWVLLFSVCHLCLSDVVEGSVVVLLFGPGLQGRRGALGWASPHGKVNVYDSWSSRRLDLQSLVRRHGSCANCHCCVFWMRTLCDLTAVDVLSSMICLWLHREQSVG